MYVLTQVLHRYATDTLYKHIVFKCSTDCRLGPIILCPPHPPKKPHSNYAKNETTNPASVPLIYINAYPMARFEYIITCYINSLRIVKKNIYTSNIRTGYRNISVNRHFRFRSSLKIWPCVHDSILLTA